MGADFLGRFLYLERYQMTRLDPDLCGWCHNHVDFLDSIIDDYGQVWHRKCYATMMDNYEPPDQYEGDGVFADNH